MADNKNDNSIAVYAVVIRIAFIVLAPLLVFVIGGSLLVEWLGWASWVKLVFMGCGILVMLIGSLRYLNKLVKIFDKNESGVVTSKESNDRRSRERCEKGSGRRKR